MSSKPTHTKIGSNAPAQGSLVEQIGRHIEATDDILFVHRTPSRGRQHRSRRKICCQWLDYQAFPGLGGLYYHLIRQERAREVTRPRSRSDERSDDSVDQICNYDIGDAALIDSEPAA